MSTTRAGEPAAAAAEPARWAPPRPTAADLARQGHDVIADLPRFLAAPLLRPWHRRWGATDAEVAGRWLPMGPHPTEATAFVVDAFEQPDWMLWRTPASSWAWRLTPSPDGRTRLVTRLRVAYDRRHPGGALLLEFGDWPMMRRMLRGIRERAETKHRRLHPPPVNAHRLAAVKAVHTAAWASIEFCVGHLLWSGARGRSDRRAAGAAAVVGGKCLVFAADGFHCPMTEMTEMAERAGAASGSVTDIYLPAWFAGNLPAIHLTLLVLIGWLHRRALHCARARRPHPARTPNRGT